MTVINTKSLKRIQRIHQLSLKFNRKVKVPHQRRLLQLIKKHAIEINDLASAQNRHYLIETGDLAILCFELLIDGRTSIDDVLLQCFTRYEKKLTQLINETPARNK